MLFHLQLYNLVIATLIEASKSFKIDIGVYFLSHKGTSIKRFQSQFTSWLASSNAMNSASIIDRVIHVCLHDLNDIGPLPSKKTWSKYEDEKCWWWISKLFLIKYNPLCTEYNPLYTDFFMNSFFCAQSKIIQINVLEKDTLLHSD